MSFWGDVHRRSRGQELRKEDQVNINDFYDFKVLDIVWPEKPIIDYIDNLKETEKKVKELSKMIKKLNTNIKCNYK